MAINTASRTYTPPTGAGTALKQTTVKPYTSTVGGKPVAQAPQTPVVTPPVTPEVVPEAVAPPQVMGPRPETQVPQDTSDIDALAQVRTQMIDELFSHDNNLKQQFYNPNIANPLLREQLAYQPQETQFGLLSSLNNLISQRKNELKAASKTMSPSEKRQFYTEQLQEEMSLSGGDFDDYVKAYKAYVPVNDIVEMYNTYNPDKQIDLRTAQSVGYKPQDTVKKAGQTYSDAMVALEALDRLEKEAEKVFKLHSGVYAIPWLGEQLAAGPIAAADPVANFQNSRMSAAQLLARPLLGTGYPSAARQMLSEIPNAYDFPWIRKQKIENLKGQLLSKIEEANQAAEGFALGKIPASNVATTGTQQPVATTPVVQPVARTPLNVNTSTGKRFTIVPTGGPTTAVDTGGL